MIILIFFYTLWAWFAIWMLFLIHFIVCYTASFFSKDVAAMVYRYTIIGFKTILPLGFFRLEIEGVENVPHDRPFLLVSNHQSILDIMLLMVGIPVPVLFVAKKELLKVPFLGWDLRKMKHIMVDRGNPRKAKVALDQVIKALKSGQNYIVFPEGTRSTDGTVAPFKRGSFSLAIAAGVPVLPCLIAHTGDAIKKGRFLVYPRKLVLRIAPIKEMSVFDGENDRDASRRLAKETHEVLSRLAKPEDKVRF